MSRWAILICVFAGVAAAQDRPPGKGVNFYSLEREIALGRHLAAEFQRDTRPLESPAVLAYLDGIGQRLAAEIGGPPFSYTFHLVADDSNPLHEVAALPGGFLFVPAPLILAARDEDELAGMLAHAIAHVASRHGTRQATRTELANLATVPLIYVGGWAGDAMRQGASLAIPLGFAQTARAFELEADRLAAAKMAAVGYDPGALARYLDRLQASYDEYSSKTFAPLPPRARRLEAIETVIGQLPPQVYTPREGFEEVQEEVRRLTASPAKQAPSLRK